MKILIIGGTKFLGRHLIEAALAKNHEVTIFNRGKFSQEEFENVEQIQGDRNADLGKLTNRQWDAVIDTCGYLPQTVEVSAEFLKDKVNQYVFISSGSVYEEIKPNYDETALTAKLNEKQLEEVQKIDPKGELNGLILGEYYGALKVLCEETIETIMPNRTLAIRAGMIVGANDWTDRFGYWVMRVAKGGEILAPGKPENFVQLINAGDLAEFVIGMIEKNVNGIFNVTSKSFDLTFGKMLGEMKKTLNVNAEFIWVDGDFLTENKVAPWSEMPFYLPESDETIRDFMTMNVDKALKQGLKFRPLSETVKEVFNWRKEQDFEVKAGISPERESELLRKWKEK